MNRLRLLYRSALALPFIGATFLIALPLQRRIIGPVFKNHTFMQHLITGGLRRLFGITWEFNQNSAPIERDRPTWYMANHPSPLDPVVLSRILNKTSFVAAGWLTRIGALRAVGGAMRTLFVSQKKEEYYKQRDRGKIVEAFNYGMNVGMHPEGWTNDGKTVELFRAALAAVLYGAKAVDRKGNEVKLEKKVVVQGIAITVKSVNGTPVSEDETLRQKYSMHGENKLKSAFELLANKNVHLELNAFEPLDPTDPEYPDEFALMNKLHSQIVAVVAPDQKEVGKAPIEATEGEDRTPKKLDDLSPH